MAAAYAPETRVVVPDYARDKHTAAGKRLGRGFEHFWAICSAMHPVAEGVPDAYREAARAVYAGQEAENGTAHRTKHIRARLATHFAAVRVALGGPVAAAAPPGGGGAAGVAPRMRPEAPAGGRSERLIRAAAVLRLLLLLVVGVGRGWLRRGSGRGATQRPMSAPRSTTVDRHTRHGKYI